MSNLSFDYPPNAAGGALTPPLMVPSSFSEATYFWLTFSGLDSVSKQKLLAEWLLLSDGWKTLPAWRGTLSRHYGPAEVELLGCLVDAGVASGGVSSAGGYRLKSPLSD
jgi:hypothetical protein